MARLLTIDVRPGPPSPPTPGEPTLAAGPLVLQEVMFADRLDRITEAIGAAPTHPDDLASWEPLRREGSGGRPAPDRGQERP